MMTMNKEDNITGYCQRHTVILFGVLRAGRVSRSHLPSDVTRVKSRIEEVAKRFIPYPHFPPSSEAGLPSLPFSPASLLSPRRKKARFLRPAKKHGDALSFFRRKADIVFTHSNY